MKKLLASLTVVLGLSTVVACSNETKGEQVTPETPTTEESTDTTKETGMNQFQSNSGMRCQEIMKKL